MGTFSRIVVADEVNMQKKISVIIPGCNTPEAWWRRCVDSVKRALGPDDEIILVDDGSSDGEKFLDAWGCRVIHKKNGGLGDARNAALKLAQGEYVTFVDSDDEVMPEVYGATINRMVATGSDVGVFEVKTVWPDDGLSKDDSFSRCGVEINGSALTVAQMRNLSRGCLMNYACNKVYRRDFLVKNDLSFDMDGMPCEDIIFNLECVMAGAKWCTVPALGYVYYRTRGTLLSRYKRTGFAGMRHGAEAWSRFRTENNEVLDKDLRSWLDARCELTDVALLTMEWRNIWLPGSPYSFLARWEWLMEHPEVGGIGLFLRQWIYVLLRRYFYFRFIRRWNILRMYPYAREIVP